MARVNYTFEKQQRAANKSRSASCGLHKSACPSAQEGAAQKVTLSSSRFVGTLSKSPLPLVGCPAPPFFVGIGASGVWLAQLVRGFRRYRRKKRAQSLPKPPRDRRPSDCI